MRLTASVPVALALGAAIVCPRARADDTVPADRPRFHFLRFEEDWSGLARPDALASRDAFDPIKYVRLGSREDVWLSLGGQARGRLAGWDDWNFGAPADPDDSFFETRLLAHADLHLGRFARVFAEVRSALTTDVDLPGGTGPDRRDVVDLQNGFLDLAWEPSGGRLTLRAGRQEMLLGRGRLVSPFDWRNVRRSFDGVALLAEAGRLRGRAFWTVPVRVREERFNDHRSGDRFYGAHLGALVPGTDVGLELTALGRERDGVVVNAVPGDEERYTLGLRAFGDIPGTRFDLELEGAVQLGEVGSEDIRAGMASAELGLPLFELPFAPRLHAAFDWASGDDRPGGTAGTFDPLFDDWHVPLGITEHVGRRNVIAASVGGALRPLAGVGVRLDLYSFWRDDRDDALYSAAGAVLRPGGAARSRHVGTEVDLRAYYRFDPHTVLGLGYGHLFPGAFVRGSGRSSGADAVYLWVRYTI